MVNFHKKGGRNPKLDPAVFRYTVRFSEEEHNRFLSMFEKSGVYAKSVFLKAHFFGQPFKVLKVDKTLVDYYTKLSDFHAQFRAIGTNYNQVVKELRLYSIGISPTSQFLLPLLDTTATCALPERLSRKAVAMIIIFCVI